MDIYTWSCLIALAILAGGLAGVWSALSAAGRRDRDGSRLVYVLPRRGLTQPVAPIGYEHETCAGCGVDLHVPVHLARKVAPACPDCGKVWSKIEAARGER